MPPRYLRKPASTHLKKCQEFRVEVCDTVTADGCCGVIPCKLCLEYVDYSGISYGSAEFGEASWAGTVGGIAFVAYWEVGYESGECEFVVLFNGEEVYRASCYEGASCRNPSGSAEASVDYEAGVLSWSVHEPRELALIDDPDTGCKTHFCGGCHCSCDCLCVTITELDGTVLNGELCDSSYECDPPTWGGTMGYYELSFTLGRDEYGECIITPTVDGQELESVAAPGCGSMFATIELYDGTVISLICKECACVVDCPCPCCPDCWRRVAGSVGGVLLAIAGDGGTDCGKPPGSGEGYEQEIVFSCTDLTDETNNTYAVFVSLSMTVRVFCDHEGGSWKAQYKSYATDQEWTDTSVSFDCPACEGVTSGGLVTGTFSFTAYDGCSTSGGDVTFPWTITIEVTVECE